MNLLNFWTKTKEPQKPGRFSDFLLTATKKERETVLKEAARRANEEQQKVFTEAKLKTKAS